MSPMRRWPSSRSWLTTSFNRLDVLAINDIGFDGDIAVKHDNRHTHVIDFFDRLCRGFVG